MGDAGPSDCRRQTVVCPPRMHDRRRRSPRLPTPETSRSSNGSLGEQIPPTYARDCMRICSLLSDDQLDGRDDCSRQRDGSAVLRDDSRHRYAPRSPHYQHVDDRKPSLPPLKTVLNGTSNSPPETPLTLQVSFQPGPREPIFTVSTYKPPGPYPNKKPRTESGFNSSPTLGPRSSMSSPGLATTTLEHRPGHSVAKENVSHGHSTPRLDYESGRRLTLYSVPTLQHERTPPGAINYQRARGFVDEAHPRANCSTASGRYRSSEQSGPPSSRSEPLYTHPPAAQPRPAADYFAPSTSDRHALPSEHATSRRSSIVSQRGFGPPPSVDPSRAGYAQSRSPHYSLPLRDDARDQPQYGGARQPETYVRAVYQDAQPTFFMPSHYDYHQCKTRKRSNLPKQSTEIMKTWFDQNIANPYPSEELKSIFSNATGISMTQVSNWFVNHRRRCPELRDKRDTTRIAGRDSGE